MKAADWRLKIITSDLTNSDEFKSKIITSHLTTGVSVVVSPTTSKSI